MLSVPQIETAALATWPALETVADGQWVARFANGFSGRSNSIWCLDPEDDAAPGPRIEMLSREFVERDLPPLYRVTPLTGRATLDVLASQGWERIKTSLVLSMPIGRTDGFDGAARFYNATDPEFLHAQAQLQGFDPEAQMTFAAIVGKIAEPACGIVLSDGDVPQAALLCVQANGIVMFYDVITASALRGTGLGRRMMATALSWGAENGASDAALQVQGDNGPAIGLYLAMGFVFRYPYHYCRPPQGIAP